MPTIDDAPIHYSSEEAHAWVAGWEAGYAAHGDEVTRPISIDEQPVQPGEWVKVTMGGEEHTGLVWDTFTNGQHGRWCHVIVGLDHTLTCPVAECVRTPGKAGSR